jgi:hypothetical protein
LHARSLRARHWSSHYHTEQIDKPDECIPQQPACKHTFLLMYEKTDWVLRKGHVLRGWGSTMAHAHIIGLYATKTVHEHVSTLSTTPSMLSRSGLPAQRDHSNASVTEMASMHKHTHLPWTTSWYPVCVALKEKRVEAGRSPSSATLAKYFNERMPRHWSTRRKSVDAHQCKRIDWNSDSVQNKHTSDFLQALENVKVSLGCPWLRDGQREVAFNDSAEAQRRQVGQELDMSTKACALQRKDLEQAWRERRAWITSTIR